MRFRVKYKDGAYYSYIREWGFYRVLGEKIPSGTSFYFSPARSNTLAEAWQACKDCAKYKKEEVKKQKTFAPREF